MLLKLNQKGVAHVLVMILLFLGIGTGVFLVQQRTNFLPKASEQRPSEILPNHNDSDGDGWSNTIENFVGTDPNLSCPSNKHQNAWPIDFNNNGRVDASDRNLIEKGVAEFKKGTYHKRLDLNADQKVDQRDYDLLNSNFGKKCTAITSHTSITPTASPFSNTESAIVVDVSIKNQKMDGFGSSQRYFDDPHLLGGSDRIPDARGGLIMNTTQQNEVLDRLYNDLGLTRIRAHIQGLIEVTNDNNDPNVTDLSKFNFASLRNDSQIDYVKRAKARGGSTYFLSPVWLEPWMGGKDNVSPAEYVEWAMAILKRWQSNGLTLPYYSIVNEPGYGRSGIWSGAWLRDVTKLLGPKMRAEGMQTMIVIPDDVRSSDAATRAQVILADPQARQYIGALATHLYDEPVSKMSKMTALSSQYNIPLWMTEFSTGAMSTAGLVGSPFNWTVMTHDLIANYNVSAVDNLFAFCVFCQDAYISLKSNGTQYLGYDLNKIYYYMGQYSRFVKQGAYRVASSSPDAEVLITAFTNPDGSLSIVAINNATVDKSVGLTLNNSTYTTFQTVVRTSATENWASLPTITLTNSSLQTTFKAKSVTTFVTNGRTVTPSAIPSPTQQATVRRLVTDDFERASLGANWTRFGGSNAEIVNGKDLGAPTNNWAFVGWKANTFLSDQFSEVVIADNKPDTWLTQVFVRQQPVGVPSGNGARYGFHYNADPGKAWWEIKYDGVNSPQTKILANSSTVPREAPGDILRIEVTGTNPVIIKGYKNGVKILEAQDSSPERITRTGTLGMVSRLAIGSTSPANTPIWASWRGGSLQ